MATIFTTYIVILGVAYASTIYLALASSFCHFFLAVSSFLFRTLSFFLLFLSAITSLVSFVGLLRGGVNQY
jgi:hypothetical protein